MIIIDISFWEFTALIDACVSTSLKGNPKQIVFLLDARWQRRSASHQQLVYETLNKAEEIGYQEIYRLFSNGNDEVEDYLLNNLQKRSFPALITENFPIVTENDSRSLSFSSLSRQFARCPVGERLGTLFVSGDRSSVGKSTSCLALLACLIKAGISPDDIGYIKPVTQCEEQQPVVEYCNHVGIECRGIGPVVFYKGFTRAFLNDETEENSQELLLKAINAVRDIESRRKFVLVDGVGYPSVGSICGLSNAQVAGSLNVPVLLIGRSGVGDAVDAHNLNSVYFQYHGCRVLGSIFNKLSLTGFYSLQACKDAVNLYFDKYGMGQRAYGYVPQLEKMIQINSLRHL